MQNIGRSWSGHRFPTSPQKLDPPLLFPSERRKTARLILRELGEEAATAEVLDTLEHRFREAKLEEAVEIAELLGSLSANSADRLRDALMQLCLDLGNSFLTEAELPQRKEAGRDPFSSPPPPQAARAMHTLNHLDPSAWLRLDVAATRDWMSRAVSQLAAWPAAEEAQASPGISGWPLNPPEPALFLPARRDMLWAILKHCLRRAPNSFDRLGPLFATQCEPDISLQAVTWLLPVASPLRRPIMPWTSLVASEPPQPVPLIDLVGGGGRQLVLARLLELTYANAKIARKSLQLLGRLGEHAAGEQVALRLSELLDGAVPAETREPASRALVSIYGREGAAGAERERLIARLLDLTHGDANSSAFALDVLSRLGQYAAGKPVAARLGELLESATPVETRRKAAVALVSMYGHHLPETVRNYLERVLAEHTEWPAEVAGTSPRTGASKFDIYLDRLLHLLEAEPAVPTSTLNQEVSASSKRIAIGPPETPYSTWLETSGRVPDLTARLAHIAAGSGDTRLLDKFAPMILSGSPAARWIGLKIAEKYGTHIARISIEPLKDSVSNLLTDTDEFVRQQAETTLASVREVVERNRRLAEVWKRIEEVPRDPQTRSAWGPRIAEIVSMATPASKTEPIAIPASPEVERPARQEEQYLDMSSLLAELQSPQPSKFAIESLRMAPDIARHPELLPTLASLAFGRANEVDLSEHLAIVGAMTAIVAENPAAPELVAALEMVVTKLSNPDREVREKALSVLGQIAPSRLPPHIVQGVEALLPAEDPGIRSAALRALASLASTSPLDAVASEEALKRLPGLLLEANPEIRAAAITLVTALGERARSAEVIAALRALLDDPRISFEDRLQNVRSFDWARRSALKALGALGPPAFDAAAFSVLNLVMDAAPGTQLAAAEAAFAMGPEARRRALEVIVTMVR